MFSVLQSAFGTKDIASRKFDSDEDVQADAAFLQIVTTMDVMTWSVAKAVSSVYNGFSGGLNLDSEPDRMLALVTASSAGTWAGGISTIQSGLIQSPEDWLTDHAGMAVQASTRYEDMLSILSQKIEQQREVMAETNAGFVSESLRSLTDDFVEIAGLSNKVSDGSINLKSIPLQQAALQRRIREELAKNTPEVQKIIESDYHITSLEFDKRYRAVVGGILSFVVTEQAVTDIEVLQSATQVANSHHALHFMSPAQLNNLISGFLQIPPASRATAYESIKAAMLYTTEERSANINERMKMVVGGLSDPPILFGWDQVNERMDASVKTGQAVQHMMSIYEEDAGDSAEADAVGRTFHRTSMSNEGFRSIINASCDSAEDVDRYLLSQIGRVARKYLEHTALINMVKNQKRDYAVLDILSKARKALRSQPSRARHPDKFFGRVEDFIKGEAKREIENVTDRFSPPSIGLSDFPSFNDIEERSRRFQKTERNLYDILEGPITKGAKDKIFAF